MKREGGNTTVDEEGKGGNNPDAAFLAAAQLKGGWNTFSGGNIENGIAGMFDNAFQLISSSGTPIVETRKEPNHAGFECGGNLIYCITPRFGIGIGASRISTGKESLIIYLLPGPTDEELRIRPEIKVTVLRLGMFYAFPFAGRLAISVSGGPALYFATYIYNLAQTIGRPGLPEEYSREISNLPETPGIPVLDAVFQELPPTGLYQETTTKQLGLEGSLGFEFNANPFVAFFVEVLGRYAKIGGFKGEEATAAYQDFLPQVFNQTGSLYCVDTDQYQLLDIVPAEGAAAGSGRKATLDFSGFSLSAGLKLRF